MNAAAREIRPPAVGDAVLWLCAALAVCVHLALLFAWRYAAEKADVIEVEGDSVEVALVEAAPSAPAPEPPKPEPPAPVPEPVPPPPEPEVIPPAKPPEMVLPEPPKPAPVPRPVATPRPAARPAAAQRSTVAAPSARQGAGSAAASGTGKINGRPAYLVRPGASYPAESRAAGEQGVVVLRVTVDAGGRPIAVRVGKSSGHPRLDRAAVEGAWRCRISNASEGAQFDAPIRFDLRN